MKRLFTAKTYNESHAGKKRPALTDKGTLRETGYVLICDETDIRRWFPNRNQAVIELETPGKYGERGIII